MRTFSSSKSSRGFEESSLVQTPKPPRPGQNPRTSNKELPALCKTRHHRNPTERRLQLPGKWTSPNPANEGSEMLLPASKAAWASTQASTTGCRCGLLSTSNLCLCRYEVWDPVPLLIKQNPSGPSVETTVRKPLRKSSPPCKPTLDWGFRTRIGARKSKSRSNSNQEREQEQ